MPLSFSGISSEQLQRLSEELRASVVARIGHGLTVDDTPAPALHSKGKRGGYAGYKSRRGLNPIRDLRLTGATLDALKPVAAGENQVSIGFTNARALKIAGVNNARATQYGASPLDRQNLIAAINRSNLQLVRFSHE